jgi:hypothetical protein
LDFFDKIIQYSITLAFQGKTLPNHLDAPLVIEGFPMVARAQRGHLSFGGLNMANKTNKQGSFLNR